MKTFLFVIVLLALPATALAQPAPVEMTPARQACLDQLRTDAEFKAYVDDLVRYAFHRDESSKATRNNQHVVMAYAAIWILTVGFVVLVFLRQGKLNQEIARLNAELARATRESGA